MMRRLLCLSVLAAALPACALAAIEDYKAAHESEGGSTTELSSTSGADLGPISTVTTTPPGLTEGGTEATDGGTSDASTTTGEPLSPPAIDDHLLTPNPIKFNGPIDVIVWSDSADGVRMELDGGSVVELIPTAPGVFEGEVLAVTGLENGDHDAALTAWQFDSEEESEPLIVTYAIALGKPGGEGLWETGDVIGIGQVPAMAVLPSAAVVEFGTLLGDGTSRCYVRKRTKGGAWGPDDLVHLLPDIDCRAVDVEVDDKGTLFFLLETLTNTGWRWSLHRMSSWGATLDSLGYGSKDEAAHALARSPGDGALAVCGSAPTPFPNDETDAMVRIFREDLPGQGETFDYLHEINDPHSFDERANGCEFTPDGKTLVVVGQVFGKHDDKDKIKQNRRFDLFYDIATNKGEFRVATAGLVSQSVASDVDIDAEGRIMIVGHICEETCEPEGQLWTLDAKGNPLGSASLGLHAIEAFAPHAVRSSPAGYVVIASGGLKGNDSAFTIQAFAPGGKGPLWVYSRKDADLLHLALSLAIGPFGEVYAGGFGANGYPAVAYIFG